MTDAKSARRGIVAVIPARAGSKRVPGKNVRDFIGQPLVAWSARAAMTCPLIDQIVVSTDDPLVVNAVAKLPVRVLDRPAHLATDQASTHDVLRHVDAELGGTNGGPELIVLLQATSPLRERDLIERCVRAMLASPNADRLIECTSQRLFTGRVVGGIWHADFPEDTRSQDLPELWYPSGRLYVYRCATALSVEGLTRDRCLVESAPRERCTNIDTPDDFAWAELVYRRYTADYQYLGA